MSIKKLLNSFVGSFIAVFAVPLLAFTPIASAATPADYTLFGETSTVAGNGSATAIQTVSDNDPGYGGIDFSIDAGTTFADITTLSTTYNITDDDCGGGSPRFQINVVEGGVAKNIMVYIGSDPSYTNCPNGWVNTGDLLETGLRIDTSQLAGGTFYDQYADALAEFGTLQVTGIELVTDGGWSADANANGDGEQTVLFDNTVINTVTYGFEPAPTKENCKKNGWKTMTNPGPFKNQGDCVSYFATGGRNAPHGSTITILAPSF